MVTVRIGPKGTEIPWISVCALKEGDPWEKIALYYGVAYFIILFVIPMAVITALYTFIAYHLQ